MEFSKFEQSRPLPIGGDLSVMAMALSTSRLSARTVRVVDRIELRWSTMMPASIADFAEIEVGTSLSK